MYVCMYVCVEIRRHLYTVCHNLWTKLEVTYMYFHIHVLFLAAKTTSMTRYIQKNIYLQKNMRYENSNNTHTLCLLVRPRSLLHARSRARRHFKTHTHTHNHIYMRLTEGTCSHTHVLYLSAKPHHDGLKL